MSTTDARKIIGGIAAVSILLVAAKDIAKEALADQSIYLYVILLTLAVISAASILSDVRGMRVGGIMSTIATFVGYYLFDPNSLLVLFAVWIVSLVFTAILKMGLVEALLSRQYRLFICNRRDCLRQLSFFRRLFHSLSNHKHKRWLIILSDSFHGSKHSLRHSDSHSVMCHRLWSSSQLFQSWR